MLKWMRKLPMIALAVVLCAASSFMPIGTVVANKISELQDQKKEINQKLDDVQSDIDSKQEEIKQVEADIEATNKQIESLDNSIGEANEKIRKAELTIEELEEKIAKLKEEIAALEKRIIARNQLIKDRALAYQASGGELSFIEVILGAQSFGDLLERADAIAIIVQADQDILKKQEEEKTEVERASEEVEKNRKKMVEEHERLKTVQASLSAQKSQKKELLESLNLKEEQIEDDVLSLKEQDEMLTAQRAVVDRLIAAERAKGNSNSNGNSGFKAGKGDFSNPSNGRLTSRYGYRAFSGSFHHGIDIAQGGTNPIWAAADGVVTRSYYSSSYGNCVFITHMINGQIYTTVYAHMRNRPLVSEGQTVTKGTQIGIMGNTGRSFGQHLHFEIHKGSWTGNKANSVNPLDYVSY